MKQVELKVYAKINISLDIVGVKDDRHLLDSVLNSVSIFDEIVVKKTEDSGVSVYANGEDFSCSNAYKSAILMQKHFNLGGFSVEIKQNIPSGGGLGGSSADSAGVIRAIEKLFNLQVDKDELCKLALQIGSDVPYMLFGGLCRLRGVGDVLNFYDYRGEEEILLCGVGEVSTAKCFALYDEIKPSICANNDALIDAMLNNKPLRDCKEYFVNALLDGAVVLNGAIETILSSMRASGLCACMSGSGAYCFGVGESVDIERAEKLLAENGIKCIRAKTKSCGIEFV